MKNLLWSAQKKWIFLFFFFEKWLNFRKKGKKNFLLLMWSSKFQKFKIFFVIKMKNWRVLSQNFRTLKQNRRFVNVFIFVFFWFFKTLWPIKFPCTEFSEFDCKSIAKDLSVISLGIQPISKNFFRQLRQVLSAITYQTDIYRLSTFWYSIKNKLKVK